MRRPRMMARRRTEVSVSRVRARRRESCQSAVGVMGGPTGHWTVERRGMQKGGCLFEQVRASRRRSPTELFRGQRNAEGDFFIVAGGDHMYCASCRFSLDHT